MPNNEKNENERIRYNRMIPNNELISDLVPLFVGHEECLAGTWCGPQVRGYHIIHYVCSGKGIFEKDGKRYHLSAGDAFIINKGDTTYYQPDDNDPWYYFWIAFKGELGEKLHELPAPVIKVKNPTIFTEPVQRAHAGTLTCEFVLSKLFLIFDEIFGDNKESDDYTELAMRYIGINYGGNLTVQKVADMVGINRSYLSRLFKAKTNTSVMEYIISLRMTKAQELLNNGMTIKQAAMNVGYSDPSAFSKMYKKFTGFPPKNQQKQAKSLE